MLPSTDENVSAPAILNIIVAHSHTPNNRCVRFAVVVTSHDATLTIGRALYEGDFCGFSYGFRPGRGPHDALDALYVAIDQRKVNWIVDADTQNFLEPLS